MQSVGIIAGTSRYEVQRQVYLALAEFLDQLILDQIERQGEAPSIIH